MEERDSIATPKTISSSDEDRDEEQGRRSGRSDEVAERGARRHGVLGLHQRPKQKSSEFDCMRFASLPQQCRHIRKH
jgi:hypothetical protein